MTRSLLHQSPVMVPAKRSALLRLETWLVFLTLWGLTVNSWLGPAFLGLALLLWAVFCLQNPVPVFKAWAVMGILPWLMPFWALISVLWSPVPDVTARGAIQFGITVALALMTARFIPPRQFIIAFWMVLGVVLLFCLVINNKHYDGLTGRTSMAGVFVTKNMLALCGGIFSLSSAAIFFDRLYRYKIRLIGFLGIWFGALMSVLAFSVGFMIVLMLGLAILTLFAFTEFLPQRLRTPYVNMMIVVALFGGAAGLAFVTTFSDELLALVGKDSTLTGRTVLWFYADRLSEAYLPLGIGFQAFWQKGFPPAEQIWLMMKIQSRQGFHFHNLYYEILMQLGYVGIAIGIVFIAYAIIRVFSWLRHNPGVVSAYCTALVVMILSSQGQEIGLFSQFELYSYAFTVAVAYAAHWSRQVTDLQRGGVWHIRQPILGRLPRAA